MGSLFCGRPAWGPQPWPHPCALPPYLFIALKPFLCRPVSVTLRMTEGKELCGPLFKVTVPRAEICSLVECLPSMHKALNQSRHGTHLYSSPWKKRQEDQEFRAILGYMKPCLKMVVRYIFNLRSLKFHWERAGGGQQLSEFQGILVYIASSRTARDTSEILT